LAYHCHVNDHIEAGMIARFRITPLHGRRRRKPGARPLAFLRRSVALTGIESI
jgi:hypothetical protein